MQLYQYDCELKKIFNLTYHLYQDKLNGNSNNEQRKIEAKRILFPIRKEMLYRGKSLVKFHFEFKIKSVMCCS
jgi:hypothetical protein